MGLDCYVMAAITSANTSDNEKEVWYGRKENEIHGWMQRKSGMSAEDFNCVELPLTHALLDELEAVTAKELPHTPGFFFGSQNDAEKTIHVVQTLVSAARRALNDGKYVYYYSWW